MADTTTTNYSLVKIEVGASLDTWGGKLNDNADAIDTQMKVNADAAGGALKKASNLSDLGSAGTARENLGVAIGTDVQEFSPNLQGISGLSTSGGQFIYTTSSGNFALANITFAGRALLDDPGASAQRTTLGLGGLATVDILDEDDMSSDSATRPPSQQSVAAYVNRALGRVLMAVLHDEKSEGVAPQTIPADTWTKRTLNTAKLNVNAAVSLSSSEFTVARDGWCEWAAPGRNKFKTRLYDVTAGSVIAPGTGCDASGVSTSVGGGAVAAGSTYRIDHISTNSTPGGEEYGSGVEVYTRVQIYEN